MLVLENGGDIWMIWRVLWRRLVRICGFETVAWENVSGLGVDVDGVSRSVLYGVTMIECRQRLLSESDVDGVCDSTCASCASGILHPRYSVGRDGAPSASSGGWTVRHHCPRASSRLDARLCFCSDVFARASRVIAVFFCAYLHVHRDRAAAFGTSVALRPHHSRPVSAAPRPFSPSEPRPSSVPGPFHYSSASSAHLIPPLLSPGAQHCGCRFGG